MKLLNKRIQVLALIAGFLAGTASFGVASVTIELAFSDESVPDGAVGILVADVAANGFDSLAAASIAGTILSPGENLGGSDDIIVGVVQADGGSHWLGSSGFAQVIRHVDYGALGISEGTPLMFHFFPEITELNSALMRGDRFVTYRRSDPGASGGTMPFVAPADPGLYTVAALSPAHGGTVDLPNTDISEEFSEGGTSHLIGPWGPADDHGDSRSMATRVSSDQSIGGQLAAGDLDFFELDLPGWTLLTFRSSGTTDTRGLLYGPAGVLINNPFADDNRGGDGNFWTQRIVQAGRYLIGVVGPDGATTGDYALNISSRSLPEVQPDGSIGKKIRSQRGDNIYNQNGRGQTLTLVSKRRKTLKYYFDLENDGGRDDLIRVTGTKKNRHFKSKYFQISGGRRNVTAGVVRGMNVNFAGLAERTYQISIKPKGKSSRKKGSFMVRARSSIAVEASDAIKATARAK